MLNLIGFNRTYVSTPGLYGLGYAGLPDETEILILTMAESSHPSNCRGLSCRQSRRIPPFSPIKTICCPQRFRLKYMLSQLVSPIISLIQTK